MGEPTGFLRYERKSAKRRPVGLRLKDWREVYEPFSGEELSIQGARCMDCGIPFCHEGCPLGNLIPEWNDFVFKGEWDLAFDRLHATNNFPEFTGRLCPAPCEGSCVLGINADPVSIKQIEVGIVEHKASLSGLTPIKVEHKTGKSVAVVGSGPAGLAAAQQLCRAGHKVVVFERAEKPGGLLRYGIPEFKMEKWVLDRRLSQMKQEGVTFESSTLIGPSRELEFGVPPGSLPRDVKVKSAKELIDSFDAILLSGGATVGRDLSIPGRELDGVFFAMEYLKPSNLVQEGELETSPIDANGKDVIIIGGGDTGADCLGTALRQGAKSVLQLEIMPKPPEKRDFDNPWPTWPLIFRTSSAHEEGGKREFSVTAVKFGSSDGKKVSSLVLQEVETKIESGRPTFVPIENSEREISADLVFLAMGFIGPEKKGPVGELSIELDSRGNVTVDSSWMTSAKGVFACGDMVRGQSLIVWAIAEGRSAAKAIDSFLAGSSLLKSPIYPLQMALK